MRLRQIVIAVDELRPVEEQVTSILGLDVAYRDPEIGALYGLRHGLYPIGDQFLEVVAPLRPGTAVGRFLDRRGPGGYMVLLQTTGIDAHRRRLADSGIRVVEELDRRPSMHSIHLHPTDVGAAIVSLDEATPPGSWHWAGPDWAYHTRTDVVRAVTAVEVSSPDPLARAAAWSRALDLPAADGRIALDDAELRFVAGAADALAAFDLEASEPGSAGYVVSIGSLELRLV